MNRKTILSFLLPLMALGMNAQKLTSPNGQMEMNFSVDAEGRPTYELSYKGKTVVGSSHLGYQLKEEFEKLISNIWLAFIKTGNPNTKGLPKWEPYNEATGITMILDNKCEPRQHHDKELMQMSHSIW